MNTLTTATSREGSTLMKRNTLLADEARDKTAAEIDAITGGYVPTFEIWDDEAPEFYATDGGEEHEMFDLTAEARGDVLEGELLADDGTVIGDDEKDSEDAQEAPATAVALEPSDEPVDWDNHDWASELDDDFEVTEDEINLTEKGRETYYEGRTSADEILGGGGTFYQSAAQAAAEKSASGTELLLTDEVRAEVIEIVEKWGTVQPLNADLELIKKAAKLPQTLLGFKERVRVYTGDLVKLRESGELMFYTNWHWRLEPNVRARMGAIITPIIRSIRAHEVELALETDVKVQKAKSVLAALKVGDDPKKAEKIERAEAALEKAEAAAVGQVLAFAKWLENRSTANLVDDVIAYMSQFSQVPESYWTKNIMLVNFLDGTVDVRTQQIREHRKDDYLTHLVGVKFSDVKNATHEDVEAIYARLDREGQEGASDFLRRFLGSGLTGSTNHKAFTYLWGPPNGGKSTLIDKSVRSLRPPAPFKSDAIAMQTNVAAFQMLSGDGTKSNPRHRIRDARLVWVDEAQGTTLDSKFINEVTSPTGETQTQPLYSKDTFPWKPQMTVVFVGNDVNGVPQQSGSQARFMSVKAGETMADSNAKVAEGSTVMKADSGILDRLETYEARCALIWQMMLGAEQMYGEDRTGDRGVLVGDCTWLDQAREGHQELASDPTAVFMRDVAVELDEDVALEDRWMCFSLQKAQVDVRNTAAYLRTNERMDRISNGAIKTYLASRGHEPKSLKIAGSKAQKWIFPRLIMRPGNLIESDRLREMVEHKLPDNTKFAYVSGEDFARGERKLPEDMTKSELIATLERLLSLKPAGRAEMVSEFKALEAQQAAAEKGSVAGDEVVAEDVQDAQEAPETVVPEALSKTSADAIRATLPGGKW